jgi:hypothetical protein
MESCSKELIFRIPFIATILIVIECIIQKVEIKIKSGGIYYFQCA